MNWLVSFALHAGLLGAIAAFSAMGWDPSRSVEVGIRVRREAGDPVMRVLPPRPEEVVVEFQRLEPRAELEHPVAPERDFEPVPMRPSEEEEEEPMPPARREAPEPPWERSARVPALRVAPSSSSVETPPSEISNPPPEYPELARRRGYEGSLLLDFEVRADGTCGEVRVLESSGHDVLDEAAVRAVRQWRFRPATRWGRPIASRQRLRVTFRLKEGP